MTNRKTNQNIGGLKELKEDNRDFLVGSLFTLPALSTLPANYSVGAPLVIKDQGNDDFCYAFASCAVSEDQEGVILDPFYTAYKTKQIEGNTGWGADIRDAAKSHCDYGAIEAASAPYDVNTPRATVLDKNSWNDAYDQVAVYHKKASYAMVSGPYDFFDNIRATIYYFKDDKRSVLTGINWCKEWLTAPNGMIKMPGTPITGHAFKVMGWATVSGVPYLVLQLSSGTAVGSAGIFMMSREVVNAGCPQFGALTFLDQPKDSLINHQTCNIPVDSNAILRMLVSIVGLLMKILNKK